MYKDRGLIKWAPFDALVGFRTNIEQMLKKRNFQVAPSLSVDQLDELNQTLSQVILGKTEVLIEYYNKGYIYQTSSVINKIDFVYKKLILKSKEELLIEQILYLEITE